MKNLDNIFTKNFCIFFFIFSLSAFTLFEFLIFNLFIFFIFIFYGICILLYFISTLVFIKIKNKNIIECIIFLISGLCLIFAGLTDIDYNFFGPIHQIIDFVPENTSDLSFILCSFLSIVLIIIGIIRIRKKQKNQL